MPEVIRGSRHHSFDRSRSNLASPASPLGPPSPFTPRTPDRRVTFGQVDSATSNPITPVQSDQSRPRTSRQSKSFERARRRDRRASVERAEQDAYYDSRAATKREFRRRASNLQEYYAQHPYLLPQLPFTFRHGFKRWKFGAYIALMVLDACIVPIVLYYTMAFAGHVQGYIIFAIVATIWGGPTYVEFGLRSWRLIKKENFFRPLGSDYRWGFDFTHWILVAAIASVTAFLVVGSAPHIVFLRVLSMPAPAILYSLSIPILTATIYHIAGYKAPFRLSSTPKGDKVRPGVYYIIEDIIAVNAGGGRPFREGLAARYEASPIFRKMLRDQSLFWSIPALILAIACTVVIIVHSVPDPVAYGIGWGVPFLWAGIWALIAVPWIRRVMHQETVTWEEDKEGLVPSTAMTPGPLPVANGHLENSDSTEKGLEEDAEAPQLKEPVPPHHSPSENSSAPTAVAADGQRTIDPTTEKEVPWTEPEAESTARTEKPAEEEVVPAPTQAAEEPEKVELPPQSPTEQTKLESETQPEVAAGDPTHPAEDPAGLNLSKPSS